MFRSLRFFCVFRWLVPDAYIAQLAVSAVFILLARVSREAIRGEGVLELLQLFFQLCFSQNIVGAGDGLSFSNVPVVAAGHRITGLFAEPCVNHHLKTGVDIVFLMVESPFGLKVGNDQAAVRLLFQPVREPFQTDAAGMGEGIFCFRGKNFIAGIHPV